MKKILLLLLAVTFYSATAAAEQKVGGVSVERIMTEAPQIEAVNTSMLERFGPQRDELVALEQEVKKLEEKYKKDELVMSQDKLNELKNEILGKVQTFKQKEAAMAQEIQTVRNQELIKLQNQVTGIIQDIAKKGKYSMILSEGIAYLDPEYDITDQVLERMKSDFKK